MLNWFIKSSSFLRNLKFIIFTVEATFFFVWKLRFQRYDYLVLDYFECFGRWISLCPPSNKFFDRFISFHVIWYKWLVIWACAKLSLSQTQKAIVSSLQKKNLRKQANSLRVRIMGLDQVLDLHMIQSPPVGIARLMFS